MDGDGSNGDDECSGQKKTNVSLYWWVFIPLLPNWPFNTSTYTDDTDDTDNEDGPLEPWGNKCKAKLAIITELKKESSPIHQFIPTGECPASPTN
jgi:hypothetical protein